MNIFLPYENNIGLSVESLDDKRLNKQILECKQLLSLAIDEKACVNISKRGYRNHPIYTHYKDNLKFLSIYGYLCCREFQYRFDKNHSLHNYFYDLWIMYSKYDMRTSYTPFYMEGSKGQSNYIRTTENVSQLYQRKLVDKWINSKYNVKWTNRDIPKFFSKYVKENWINCGTFGGKDGGRK